MVEDVGSTLGGRRVPEFLIGVTRPRSRFGGKRVDNSPFSLSTDYNCISEQSSFSFSLISILLSAVFAEEPDTPTLTYQSSHNFVKHYRRSQQPRIAS